MDRNIEEILEKRFTPERVSAWKQEYAPRKLCVLGVEDKLAVLRPIRAAELSQYSMLAADPSAGIEKASRYLLDALWIDGDAAIRDDEECFMAAMLQLQNVIELKKSAFWRV